MTACSALFAATEKNVSASRETIPQCAQVKDGSLTLAQLQLSQLPTWVEEKRCAKALRKLDLRRNRLTALPDVSRLKLTSLSLHNNCVRGALGAAGLPASLEHLNVSGNQLTSVDAALLSSLPRLAVLDLHGNHLTSEVRHRPPSRRARLRLLYPS